MKAIIFAAGKGVRMLPLTETIPKVLIPVNGKPFLWYVLENLRKAGITEYGIVAGYMKEKVELFCAEYRKEHPCQTTILHQSEQRGTAHALQQAKEYCGLEQFIVQGGDNLFSVEDLCAIQKKDPYCYIMGKEEREWQKYGILVLQGERVVRIVEKPKAFVGNTINTGLYKFTPDVWNALDMVQLSPRGEYELTDALTFLAEQNKLRYLPLKGYWLDLGMKEDILKIEDFLRKKAI